jgi:glyoxalase family protein
LPDTVHGIHHVTALASDPQGNVEFYTGVLGLRLVKQTVNFDAPDVYHLYYGDETGQPGSVMTFFPFPGSARGKRGTGEISAVTFLAPERSLEFWAGRLSRHDVPFDGPLTRFGEQYISFEDPDGMRIDVVFSGEGTGVRHWAGSPVPGDSAIGRIRGVTLFLRDGSRSGELLTQTLGFRASGKEGGRTRYAVGEPSAESTVNIEESPGAARARQSAGSVHHVAWRARQDEEQGEWKIKIENAGLIVTDVLDRRYFRSIYFREPGEVLFEIATDPPGFTVDEPLPELGTHLRLPPWLEPGRDRIERSLPPLLLRPAAPSR